MEMIARIALLLFGLICSIDVAAYETDALVSIRQDSAGLGARTWELFLKTDGTVIEETYNIYARDISSMDIVKKVRRVPKRQIPQLVASAAKLIEGLPHDVGKELVIDPVTKEVVVNPVTKEPMERIVVDPETKAIRIRLGEQELFAGWSSYESTQPNDKTEQFQRAWQSLQDLLRGADETSKKK